MTTKNRLIILLALIVLFFTVTPYLVLYSLGYRIDFENKKIVATGGIYIKVLPSGANVFIDGEISDSTGIFSNAFFVQNLPPKEYSISIIKDSYYDYQKKLLVKEKEVTKLENVILFSKNIPFELSPDKNLFSLLKQEPLEKFIIKNNNLYYSNAPENSQLTDNQKSVPILKSIVAFKASLSNITWLGLDGFLKQSDQNGQNTEKLNQIALKIDLKKTYQLDIFSQNIFLKEGDNLLVFDQATKLFKEFYNPVKEIEISPDGQKIIYFNDNEVFIYYFNNLPVGEKNNLLLAESTEKITDLYWLNNDYLVFSSANKIVISEIDSRGNINAISLPETVHLINDGTINIIKPEIFFDQINKKLYIVTQNQLIASDKLLP